MAEASVDDPSHARRSALLQGRVSILFRLARYDLSFPFAALCMAAALFRADASLVTAGLPIILHIAVTVYGGWLKRAYHNRGAYDDPAIWARHYTILSAVGGAVWGIGAVIWFDASSFAAEAYLVLAFLGMSTIEFIARSAYRPAYLAHAIPSLGPLAVLLALQGGVYPTLAALLLIFLGGVLYSYGETLAELVEASILLRHDNVNLIERLNQEKRSAETTRDLAQANERAKSAFISNISHELRTPLNAILGMAQLLEKSELEKLQRDHVKVLLEAGRGLTTLLDDVIALASDPEDNGVPPEEGCDAAQAARTVVRLLQPNAWEKRLRLSLNVAPGLPRVTCDARLLRRVLLKIAGNAIKYTERGHIEIALDQIKDGANRTMVRFAITDTGPGIPEDLQATVFEPFTKLEAVPTGQLPGPGVGLAVAKRLIELTGGAIGVESETGMGARFWITIPGTQAPISVKRGDESVPPPMGLTLLVLARDQMMRATLDRALTPFGNRITFAENLGQASTISARGRFDVILSTAAHVDSLAATPSQHTPILALTTWDERPPAGADHVLRWPAGADALYAGIATVMGEGAAKVRNRGKPEREEEANFDAKVITELERSFGLSTLLDILQSYMSTAQQLAASVTAASERADWQQAGRLGQDFAGAAGGLGLTGVTIAARALAQSARDGASNEALAKAADDVLSEHRRVSEALRRLYPDLAAEPAPADAA